MEFASRNKKEEFDGMKNQRTVKKMKEIDGQSNKEHIHSETNIILGRISCSFVDG